MIPLLLVLTLASPPVGVPPAKTRPTPALTHALFGLLTEQAHLSCAGIDPNDFDDEGTWSRPYHEVGFVRLVDPAFDATPLTNRPVLVLGTPKDGPPPARNHPCHAFQARSDWAYGKNGNRLRRQIPPHVAFHPTSVTPLGPDVLRARRLGDQIEVTFRDPLDRPLTDVLVTLHHEGCYGKPMTAERDAAHPRLAPGDVFTARLPAIVDRGEPDRVRRHAAHSVAITATGERVAFDLDVPLAVFGAAVECPDRGRKR